MIDVRNCLMILAATVVSVTATADDVYKSVGPDGVVEYSDTPQPDSQKIEVNPNVIEVTPATSSGTAQKPPAGNAAPQPAETTDPAVVYEGDSGDHYDPVYRPAEKRAVNEAREPGVVPAEPKTEAGVGNGNVNRDAGVDRARAGGRR